MPFEFGDYVRMQFVPGIEHPSLMTGVFEITRKRSNREDESQLPKIEYLVSDNSGEDGLWAKENQLRYAHKYEILEHKLLHE